MLSLYEKQSLLNLFGFTTEDVAANGTTELTQFFKWSTGAHARDLHWKWATLQYQLKLVQLSFLLLYHTQATSVMYLKPHFIFLQHKGRWFSKFLMVFEISICSACISCTHNKELYNYLSQESNFVIAERIYTVCVKLVFFFSNFQLSGWYKTVCRYICLH